MTYPVRMTPALRLSTSMPRQKKMPIVKGPGGGIPPPYETVTWPPICSWNKPDNSNAVKYQAYCTLKCPLVELWPDILNTRLITNALQVGQQLDCNVAQGLNKVAHTTRGHLLGCIGSELFPYLTSTAATTTTTTTKITQ